MVPANTIRPSSRRLARAKFLASVSVLKVVVWRGLRGLGRTPLWCNSTVTYQVAAIFIAAPHKSKIATTSGPAVTNVHDMPKPMSFSHSHFDTTNRHAIATCAAIQNRSRVSVNEHNCAPAMKKSRQMQFVPIGGLNDDVASRTHRDVDPLALEKSLSWGRTCRFLKECHPAVPPIAQVKSASVGAVLSAKSDCFAV